VSIIGAADFVFLSVNKCAKAHCCGSPSTTAATTQQINRFRRDTSSGSNSVVTNVLVFLPFYSHLCTLTHPSAVFDGSIEKKYRLLVSILSIWLLYTPCNWLYCVGRTVLFAYMKRWPFQSTPQNGAPDGWRRPAAERPSRKWPVGVYIRYRKRAAVLFDSRCIVRIRSDVCIRLYTRCFSDRAFPTRTTRLHDFVLL